MGDEGGPRPVAVKQITVIEGGYLKEPWAVPLTSVDGKDFLCLSKGDRKLARFVGLDMNVRNPWGTNQFLRFLTKLRDAKVDALLRAALASDDPMADEVDDEMASGDPMTPCKGRHRRFEEANIPSVITVASPELVRDDGIRVPPHEFNVISTPKKDKDVMIEVTTENMQWISEVAATVQHSVPTPARKRASDLAHIELSHPECKWRRRRDHKKELSVMVDYYGYDHKWHTHWETPEVFEDDELCKQAVREAEDRAHLFYTENHQQELYEEDAARENNEP